MQENQLVEAFRLGSRVRTDASPQPKSFEVRVQESIGRELLTRDDIIAAIILLERLLKYTRTEYQKLSDGEWLDDGSRDDLNHRAFSQGNLDKLRQEPGYGAGGTFRRVV